MNFGMNWEELYVCISQFLMIKNQILIGSEFLSSKVQYFYMNNGLIYVNKDLIHSEINLFSRKLFKDKKF